MYARCVPNRFKLADIMDWPMPTPRRAARRARYVVAPSDTEDDSGDNTESYLTANEASDSEDDVPLARLRGHQK